MTESMDDYLARLNLEGKRTTWIQNRVKIDYVFRKVKKRLKNVRTVCEVGVGEGYLLRLLRNNGLKVVGIDISKYVVDALKNKFDSLDLGIQLIHGDISEIQIKNKFDAFFCLDVLEHIPNIKKAIKNIKKGLHNGGLLIATLPLHENLDRKMAMCPKCNKQFHILGHYHSFSNIQEIKELLSQQFKIVEVGEVKEIGKALDAIRYLITKILSLISREKNTSTIYFFARRSDR